MTDQEDPFYPSISYDCFSPLSPNSYKILQINAQSLNDKLHLLEAEIIYYEYPEIIVVSETWMKNGTEHSFGIGGYTACHFPRHDGYGGISVYLRNGLKHSTPHLSQTQDSIQTIEINLHNPSFTLIAVYRPPSSSVATFNNFIDGKLDRNNKSILCGDININLLANTSETRDYVDVISANSYYILNEINQTAATLIRRTTTYESFSILDHFVTNMIDKSYIVRLNASIGDHKSVLLVIDDLNSDIQSNPQLKKTMDHIKIKNELIHFLSTKSSDSIETFHREVNSIILRNTTTQPAQTHSKLPWVDDQVVNEMNKRNGFYREAHEIGLTQQQKDRRISKFKAQKNRVTAIIRRKKRIFVARKIDECMNDKRKMWKILGGIFKNNLSCSQATNLMPEKLVVGQETFTDPQAKLNGLNGHFAKVGTTVKQRLNDQYGNRPRNTRMPSRNQQSIFLDPVTVEELSSTIMSLKSEASSGYDNVSARTLKQALPHLTTALLPLINQCFTTGHFPSTFKRTIIIPLYKGTGDKSDPNNYRPVSIISNLSKLFEKILYKRILTFLTNSNFFANYQFGFLPGSNTTTAILQAVDRIKSGLDDGDSVAALFFDISKAFDCVEHELLLEKLDRVGIRGVANELIQDYLFGRTQRVRAGEGNSTDTFMVSGIPQGSALSTLLFLIYTNDLHEIGLEGNYQTFADDTAGIYVAKDPIELNNMMSRDIERISEWFYNNFLSVNVNKTKLIVFKMRNKDNPPTPSLSINGTSIERVKEYKYLGFTIDDCLSFASHIAGIKSKIFPFLSVLKRTKYLIPDYLLREIYFAHIHSHLVHLISVWGFANEGLLDQLQILQNKAIRFVFWRDYVSNETSTVNLYQKFKILNIRQLLRYDTLLSIEKMRRGLLKNNVELTTFSEIHGYNTRRRHDFVLPGTRTTTVYKSLFREGLSWHNRLPVQLKNQPSLNVFKSGLKSHVGQW